MIQIILVFMLLHQIGLSIYQPLPSPLPKAGVQKPGNYLKRLDSGLRLSACEHAQAGRNVKNRCFPTFYETTTIGLSGETERSDFQVKTTRKRNGSCKNDLIVTF
ncbi:MAG: hypothetical protein JW932_19340 [Deltaproteobacteria bacterium]|nr:hypothetical protein [Deltaproteobacteria bacterium]